MVYSPAINEEKGNSCMVSLDFMPFHPAQNTFQTFPIRHGDRLHTNSTGKRSILRNCQLHFELVYLAMLGHVMPGCHPSYSFPASPKTKTRRRIGKYLSGLGATGTLGGTGLEAVQEAAVDITQGTHAAGAGGLAALGLLAPVDYCDGNVSLSSSNVFRI